MQIKKHFGVFFAFSNRVAKADDPVVSGRPMLPLSPQIDRFAGAPRDRFWVFGYRERRQGNNRSNECEIRMPSLRKIVNANNS